MQARKHEFSSQLPSTQSPESLYTSSAITEISLSLCSIFKLRWQSSFLLSLPEITPTLQNNIGTLLHSQKIKFNTKLIEKTEEPTGTYFNGQSVYCILYYLLLMLLRMLYLVYKETPELPSEIFCNFSQVCFPSNNWDPFSWNV